MLQHSARTGSTHDTRNDFLHHTDTTEGGEAKQEAQKLSEPDPVEARPRLRRRRRRRGERREFQEKEESRTRSQTLNFKEWKKEEARSGGIKGDKHSRRWSSRRSREQRGEEEPWCRDGRGHQEERDALPPAAAFWKGKTLVTSLPVTFPSRGVRPLCCFLCVLCRSGSGFGVTCTGTAPAPSPGWSSSSAKTAPAWRRTTKPCANSRSTRR